MDSRSLNTGMARSINIILKGVHFPGISFEDKHPVYAGIQERKEVVDAVVTLETQM